MDCKFCNKALVQNTEDEKNLYKFDCANCKCSYRIKSKVEKVYFNFGDYHISISDKHTFAKGKNLYRKLPIKIRDITSIQQLKDLCDKYLSFDCRNI